LRVNFLPAVLVEANNPAHVPPGELRNIERLDETGRLRCIDWIGQEHFCKQMMRPGRRVVAFRRGTDFTGRPT
jgi:hypothetical protein